MPSSCETIGVGQRPVRAMPSSESRSWAPGDDDVLLVKVDAVGVGNRTANSSPAPESFPGYGRL